MSLARRSLQSSFYNVLSHALQVAILFVRSVLLARLLTPDIFGVYAFAQALILTTLALPHFGLGTALVHHAPETDDPDAPGVYLTLISAFSLLWAIALIVVGALFMEGERRLVLWALVAITFFGQMATTGETLLARRVHFGRLALIYLLTALLSSMVALFLAWRGAGVWSLVSVDLLSLLLLVLGLYVVRPVWRPRFAWSPPIVRYFLRFGSRCTLADLLVTALDRVDDLWAGRFLGDAALGLYSRAYTFANYPRRVLASPVNAVSQATYAELKGDRARLSQAFTLVNMLLVRSGFFFAGALLLIAPEFTRLLLGAQWLPMLAAFRWMVAYTMLDPIKYTIGYLFNAVGRPEILIRTRAIQLAVLVGGLFLLGPRYGIAGVAVAATVMAVVGVGLLLWQARRYVEVALLPLFGVPAVALGLGVAVAASAAVRWLGGGSDWLSGGVKLALFTLLYAGIVVLAERQRLREILTLMQRVLRSRTGAAAPEEEA